MVCAAIIFVWLVPTSFDRICILRCQNNEWHHGVPIVSS